MADGYVSTRQKWWAPCQHLSEKPETGNGNQNLLIFRRNLKTAQQLQEWLTGPTLYQVRENCISVEIKGKNLTECWVVFVTF